MYRRRRRGESESPLRTEADMNTTETTENRFNAFFDTSEYVSCNASMRRVLSNSAFFSSGSPGAPIESSKSTPIPSTPESRASRSPSPFPRAESAKASPTIRSREGPLKRALRPPIISTHQKAIPPIQTNVKQEVLQPPPAKKSSVIVLKPIILGKKQPTPLTEPESGSKVPPPQEGMTEEERDVNIWVRNWGLPSTVAEYYTSKGIRSFYEWQIKCLSNEGFTSGKNLVYTLPTSSGKTLVAEIALLKCVILERKIAVFVLPFVSIVVEKMRSFDRVGREMDFIVDGFYGSRGQLPLAPGARLVVGTIERVNGLVNSLIEENRLGELGCVVVDEVHMVGDGERGATLELLLSKLVYHSFYANKTQRNTLQILAMSATVPNVDIIGRWLRAETFSHEFRPVPLHEYTLEVDSTAFGKGNQRRGRCDKGGKTRIVCDKSGRRVRTITLTDKDFDGTVLLCSEVVPEHSVLVFCSTKALTQTTAALIAETIGSYKPQKDSEVPAEEEERARKRKRKRLLELLAACTGGHLNETLAKTVPKGVAFHNAGLTTEEREVIEQGYRDHVINVLCSTSTLAVGVNLPARRVIIRSPFVGRDPMSPKYYKQMAGRAGRAGYDTFGECFLILQNTKDVVDRGKRLLQSDVEAIHSCLLSVNTRNNNNNNNFDKEEKKGIERLILEGVCQSQDGTVTFEDVTNLVGCTFLAAENANTREILEANGERVVQGLMERHFVTKHERDGATYYKATKLGKATFHSCFLPEEAKIMHKVLEKANNDGVILLDDVHICYLLTPLTNLVPPNWETFAQILRMHECGGVTGRNQLRYTLGRIGARISTVDRRATGGCPKVTAEEDLALRRLYNALILSDLVHERPLADVAAKYGAQTGTIQGLMQSAGSFARMSVCFCHNMEWSALEAVLNTFVERLNLGIKAEIIPLTEISGVGRSRARALWNAGFKSVEAIARTSVDDLRRHVHLGPFDERAATMIVQGAINMLKRKAAEMAKQAESLPDAAAVAEKEEAELLTGEGLDDFIDLII